MRLVPALAASTLLLAACGTSSADDSTASTPDAEATTPVSVPIAEQIDEATAVTETPATASDVVAAPAALQFSAPLVGGGELDATSLAGKPTVFWFWAPT
jgi:hypothetical protein